MRGVLGCEGCVRGGGYRGRVYPDCSRSSTQKVPGNATSSDN